MNKRVVAFALLLCCIAGMVGCGAHTQEKEVPADMTDERNLEKVVEIPTFEITQHEKTDAIIPHGTVTSGMVLQRRCVNLLSGTTQDAHIAALFQEKFYYGTVENGTFEIYLPPMEAGGPYTLVLYSDSGCLTLTDVYVGEVFLMAGQSNMAYSMEQCGSVMEEMIRQAGSETIRFYQVPISQQDAPLDTVNAVWQGIRGDNVGAFSAFAYLFGLRMEEVLSMPIGLVLCAQGGTPISYWLPAQEYAQLRSDQGSFVTELPPSGGYNGMIHPVTRLRYRSVVWYQGETNAGAPTLYYGELTCLIRAYRTVFGDSDLGFTIVELPRFGELPEGWAMIRQAQQQAAADLEQVCMSVSIDQGDMADVHPADKREMATRAANETLRSFFGVQTDACPVIAAAKKINSNTVKLTLEHAQGLVLANGSNGFAYSPDGTRFYAVTSVELDGNTITVTAPEEIRALRYGYQIRFDSDQVSAEPARQVTVFNGAGLPLDQFLLEFDT